MSVVLFSCFLLAAFFFVQKKHFTLSLPVILLLGFLVRFICSILFLSINNFDLDSYRRIGDITLQGISIYPDHAPLHHPYFPFFLYIEAFAMYIEKFGIHPILFLKLIFSFFDLGIIYLVYLLTNKTYKNALYYALNPVTVLISNLHGQFDVIPLFFFLWGLYAFIKARQTLSMFILSIAILTKTWPILFIIPVIKRIHSKKYLILLAFFPIIATVIYAKLFSASVWEIIQVVKNYRSLSGEWGISYFVTSITHDNSLHATRILRILFLLLFTIFAIGIKRKNIFQEIVVLLLFFYSFTFGFAIQYFTWIVPFLFITKVKASKVLMSVMTAYLCINYFIWDLNSYSGKNMLITASSILTWCMILYVFFQNIGILKTKREKQMNTGNDDSSIKHGL